ncbi:MAG TPA: sigma-70 family RNA polymerase sigma factor [Cyclobacteriaceae bacterium]|nr:sigma-70 family RNA polymerase sigma factor [Cyclobacteriaceae bacterium]
MNKTATIAFDSSAAISEEMYESAFPVVAAWVRKMNGSLEDARDVFHDALVLYHEKIIGGVSFDASPEAYILGIAKHLWLRKFRRSKHLVQFDGIETDISIPDDFYAPPSTLKLLNFLERAGKNCMELLRRAYYEKQSASELAQKMGYSGERSATVQKYKCIEKLRTIIKQKSISYEDFTD